MDKKEFIFPGVILGVVVLIAVGLIISHSSERPTLIETGTVATSTATTTPAASTTTPSTTTPSPTSYYPYGSVTLALNHAAGFKDGLSIRPLKVLEDSRCPMGVMCIQAGTVRLSVKVDVNGRESERTIELGKSITANGDTITFTSVEPLRHKEGAPAASEYRFTFTVAHAGTAGSQCYVGGCSGQICSDTPDAVSNCMYRPEYACYKTATCARQANGSCGWTQTTALTKCLANPS